MRAMELLDFVRYAGALIIVLSLIGLAGLAARRYGLPGIAKSSGKRRLAVVETLMVGPRHKLYLLSRDSVEHLVLVGPQGASVIEAGGKPVSASPPGVS
jgi:flagellar protein FliO/FliZ